MVEKELKLIVGRMSGKIYEVKNCPICGSEMLKLEAQDKRTGDYFTLDTCEKCKSQYSSIWSRVDGETNKEEHQELVILRLTALLGIMLILYAIIYIVRNVGSI